MRASFDVDVDVESDLAEIIDRYDAIVIRSATKLTAELIGRATNLKVIGRAGVGVDNVDVDAATRRGIVVANAPESNVVSAAEHTIGLLVALARNIPQAHAALKAGPLGARAVGRGRARREDARRARVRPDRPAGRAPRARVADARRRLRPVRVRRSRPGLGVETESLDGVLARADFLTLHLPANEETRGVIDAASIAKMKDGVRIVNAARGELVDEGALLDALRSGKVAAAALDVFGTEPYSGPLLASRTSS